MFSLKFKEDSLAVEVAGSGPVHVLEHIIGVSFTKIIEIATICT